MDNSARAGRRIGALLLNQLVYLLAAVETKKTTNGAHERQNLLRMIDLHEKIGRVTQFRDAYVSSLEAIDHKGKERGIDLTQDLRTSERVKSYIHVETAETSRSVSLTDTSIPATFRRGDRSQGRGKVRAASTYRRGARFSYARMMGLRDLAHR